MNIHDLSNKDSLSQSMSRAIWPLDHPLGQEEIKSPEGDHPVSYTHLTLPTKRIV